MILERFWKITKIILEIFHEIYTKTTVHNSSAHSSCYLLTNTIYIAFNSGCKWINNRVYIQSRLDSGQPKSCNAFWCWRIFDRKIRRLTSNHLFHLVLIPRQVKLCIHCLLFFLYVKTFHLKGLNFAISTDSSEMWQKYLW